MWWGFVGSRGRGKLRKSWLCGEMGLTARESEPRALALSLSLEEHVT
jgi:hypothetical protein